jgi:carbohydrate-selective porin OprB
MRVERKKLRFAAIGSLLIAALPAFAQQPPAAPGASSTEDNFRCPRPADPHRRALDCNDHAFGVDETLAERWDDVRRLMQRIGITPTASYTGALQTNVTGGSHEVWSYAGLLSLGLSTDFGELLKIPGLSAYVGAAWGTGSDLAASLDSTIQTSGLYAPSIYLGQMYLQERLKHGKLTVLAGRLAAASAFASLPVFNNYVTYGINPNPYSLGANDVTFFGPPPGSEWGAQATYTISPAILIAAGIFNTNVNSANGANHGTDFALQEGNKGVLSIAEIDYLTHQRNKSKGKPGQITLGFLHSSDSFPVLNNPLVRSDGYSGLYLMAQQMVYRPGGAETSQGATVWGAWTWNSKELVSQVPVFWSGGVSYVGIIPARKNDVVSLALIRTEGSKYDPSSSTEGLLELNYQWFHSRYLTITPHGQYLWNAGNGPVRNSLVLGVQLGLTL